MTGWAVALAGWLAAGWLLVRLRRRRELVADAEHELRGAITAIGLALERVALGGYTALLRLQLERAEGALGALSSARRGESAGALRAHLLANLIANATEHGAGELEVKSERRGEVVRLELRNRNRAGSARGGARAREPFRGRGLRIAARAAEELGGTLRTEVGEATTVATVELPVAAADGGSRDLEPVARREPSAAPDAVRSSRDLGRAA